MISVLIADDHPIVRSGLKQLISDEPGMCVSAEASSGDELLAALQEEQPDVVLCDMSMPGRNGLDLIKTIRSRYPDLPVLVLSMHDEDAYAVRTIKAGAMGYVSKASPAEQLLGAIRRVAAGRLFINEDVAERLARHAMGGDAPPHARLSQRELQVFAMLADGMSVTAIAQSLSLSVKTVSTHKTNLMRKMGMSNMSELLRYAIEHGLTSTPCL